MKILIPIAAVSAAIALMGHAPAQAQAPARDPQRCFDPRRVANYAVQDDHTVNVRVGVKDVYQLKLQGDCPDVGFTPGVGIVGESSSVCNGIDIVLTVPGPVGPRRCDVDTVRHLSEAEVSQLPPKGKP